MQGAVAPGVADMLVELQRTHDNQQTQLLLPQTACIGST